MTTATTRYASFASDNMTIIGSPRENDNKLITSTADELANLIVKESNKRKNQLPAYPGVERFALMRKLGDGAFSNVFEARDLKSGMKVALKVAQKKVNQSKDQQHLHSSLIKKPRVTERANIMKEVQIMRDIRHPNIVQLMYFTETPDNYFLALEICEGGELFHRIVKLTYFSEELSRHVIVQVAQAVRYLHEQRGVVHRDIKPENILFDPIPVVPSKKRVFRPTDNPEAKVDEGEFYPGVGGGGIGRVKLADFGLSKVIWNDSTFTPCGTVGYTAPEVVKDRNYSKSVDMWAIGCVLYTILCGFPPFYDESIQELTAKVARGQYTFLSPWWDTMSESVKDLISHLLCVDVRKRYTINQFFEHPWVKQEPFIKDDLHNNTDALRQYVLQTKQKHAMEEEKEQQEMAELDALTPADIHQNDDLLMDDDNSMIYTTPDATTLRGIFDVTYAVQRMGEEGSPMDESQDTTHYTGGAIHVPATQRRDNLHIAQKLAMKNRGVANPTHFPVHNHKSPTSPAKSKKFHLNMNNATLLNNRRHN